MVMASLSATAEIVISVGSKHISTDLEFNEFNPGVGHVEDLSSIAYKYAPDYFSYGVYYNSMRRVSVYSFAGYMVSKNLSFEVGPVSGYQQPVIIGVIGVIHFDMARVIIIPPVPSLDAPLVIGLQIRI